MVKAELQTLIDLLRENGNASQTDSFNGITYWTDEQLQDILEQSSEWREVELGFTGSGYTHAVLDLLNHEYIEDDVSVLDSDGNVVSTNSTYNPKRKEIVFDADEKDAAKVETYVYNMLDALILLYRKKCQHREKYVKMDGGNNKLHMEQEWQHCQKMLHHYQRKIAKRVRVQGKNRWLT